MGLRETDAACELVELTPGTGRIRPGRCRRPWYEIARLYLTLKGYHARYFTGGMLKLVDYLRGDKARDYLANI